MSAPPVSDSLPIDGFGPLPVHAPESVAELGDIVRAQVNGGQAVYPGGGGDHIHHREHGQQVLAVPHADLEPSRRRH